MRKLLLFITISLMSGIWSTSWAAAPTITKTEYQTSSTKMTTMLGNTFEHRRQRVVETPHGDVLILWFRGSTTGAWISKFSTATGLWTVDTSVTTNYPFPIAGSPTNHGLYQIGDTVIAYLMNVTDSTRIRRYVRTTAGTLDTVPGLVQSTSNGRGSFATVTAVSGQKLLYVDADEAGANDSIQVYLGAGTTPPITWSRKWSVETSTKWPVGIGAAFSGAGTNGGGVGWLEINTTGATENYYWADSTRGDTLSTAIVPQDIPNSYAGYGMITQCWVHDTVFNVAWQAGITAGTDSIVAREYAITNIGAGSGSIVTLATTVIATAAQVKDGHGSCLSLSHLSGTDTTILTMRQYPDVNRSGSDSVNVVCYISPDDGATWGGPYIIDSAKTNRKAWQIQTPQTVYHVSDSINVPIVMTDSVGVATDTGTVLIAHIVPSGTLSQPTGSRVLIRK